jgi:hypothetical protein
MANPENEELRRVGLDERSGILQGDDRANDP